MSDQIPFSVIGGFLGAGKTSLVNHLLTQAGGRRYAVLVNDFGALNIDARLIQQHDGETMALANGCVCCSMAAGFTQGVGKVLDQIEKFDHIVVEASGVSDPARIQDLARVSPQLKVGGVTVVLDGKQIMQQAKDRYIGEHILTQLSAADLLLVNKQDLMTTADQQQLDIWLNQVNPVTRIYSQFGQVDPQYILMCAAQNTGPDVTALQSEHGFEKLTVSNSEPVSRHDFLRWCEKLPQTLFRGKGFVRFLEQPEQLLLWQKVMQQVQLTESPETTSTVNGCEIVLIGHQLSSVSPIGELTAC